MLFDGQRIGGRRGGRFFQKRMQPAEQRLDLLWIEHRRRYQERRRTGGNERRIVFQVRFQLVFFRCRWTGLIWRHRCGKLF
jgi:hypothetical protein